jgi:thiol-disulfide isomerase/thioredoxin
MLYIGIAIVIVCILITVYLYRKRKRNKETSKNTTVQTIDVYYFYTTWCPYCVKARPEWDKFKTYWNNKKKNGYVLLFSEIDCDKNESLASKYDVETYPTIKLMFF